MFGGNLTPINATFTNNSTTVTFSALPAATYTTSFRVLTLQFDSYSGLTTFFKNDPVTFSVTSGSLPSPLVAGTTYYLAAPVTPSNGSPIIVSSTPNGPFIGLTTTGSGSYVMTDLGGNLIPISNQSNVVIAWNNTGTGSTSGTLSSPWNFASGIYNLVDSIGDNIQAIFTYNSNTITPLSPTIFQPAGNYQVQILNTSPATSQAPYRAYVSKVDGNLYFANGRWVGRISYSVNTNATFNPGLPQTYSVSYAATGTLQSQDTVIDMVDLRGQMIISGNKDTYPWDYVSAQPASSSPVGEQIYRSINLLNNIYILAGQKGNIYISNGATASLFNKIPDYIAGIIDPVWSWGDLMIHRSKLFFQAFAKSTSGTNLLYGIFSLNASPAQNDLTTGALTMESQNSVGLVPVSGALPNGILIDNEPSSNGQDSYYSAYSTGSTTGTIDYNDTTLWQNFEPFIETDIIPIGGILNKKTFGNIEFKIDRPMTSGDQLKLYWRPSLSDSYIQIGPTFTNQQLSDYAPSDISQSQWAQFGVSYKAASSNSSFLPLKEIRLHVV